ncbi:MAG: tetratricopeptide repeat protein [Candidatus Hydrogenedens sp.]
MGRRNWERNTQRNIVNDTLSSFLRKTAIYVIIPLWLLAVVLSLSPFTGDPAAPIKYLIISVFVMLLSAITLGITGLGNFQPQFKMSLIFVLSGFLLFLLLSTLFARNKGFAISELSIWIMLCGIALFVHILVTNEKEIRWILTWVMVAIALSSVYGFFQRWGIDPFPWSTKNVEEYRGLPSSYANPNFAGHALLFAVITGIGFLVTLFNEFKNIKKEGISKSLILVLLKLLLFSICFILTFIHLYLTKMRSARIALAVAITFFVFYLCIGKKWRTKTILTLGGVLVSFAVVSIIIIFVLLARGYPEGSLPLDNSLNLRLNGYSGAVQMIKNRPILGYGPGNYRFENIPYWTRYEKLWFTLAKKRNFHVHSDPLEAMTDAGIPGGLFYFGLILLGFIGGLSFIKKDQPFHEQILGITIASVFLAFAMDACFGFNMRVPVSSALFFLYLGLSQANVNDVTINIKKVKWLLGIAFCISILLVILQSRYYYADVQLQKARGGMYWAQIFANQQKFNSRELALERALQNAETGNQIKYFDPRFFEITARIYMAQNNFEKALENFDKAICYDSYNPELWTSSAQCYLNWIHHSQIEKKPLSQSIEKILDEAEKSLANAIKYCDLYPDAYEGMARTLFFQTAYLKLPEEKKQELMQDVIRYGEKAFETGLQNSQSLLQILIQAHLAIKDYDGCAKVIQRALSIEPGNIELWSRYATVMKQKGYPDEYLSFLEKNYAKFKKDAKTMAPTLSQLALMIHQEILRKTNDTRKASEIILETLKLNPGDLTTWGTVIQTVPREQRLENIRKLMNYFKNTPDIPDLVQKMNKQKEQIDWLEISRNVINKIEQDEKNKVPYKTIVLKYVWIADVVFHENTTSENENKGEIYANLATIYQKLRFEDLALVCFPFASKSTSKSTQLKVMYTWADILYRKNRYKEAEEKLQQALQIDPNNTQTRVLLVKTLLQLKKIPEARFEYQSLKQSLPANSNTLKSLEQLLAPYLETH